MGVYRVGRSYYFRFRFKGQHVRTSVGPVSKRLAELAEDAEKTRMRARWIAQRFGVEDPDRGHGGAPTLDAYVRDTYLPTHLPRVAPSSQRQLRSLSAKLVRDLPRGVRLDELGPVVLDRWAAKRLGEHKVSAAQVVNDGRALSAIINHWRRQHHVKTHPMHGWKWPVAAPSRFHVVTPAEEQTLARAADAPFRPWMRIALATGLRKGELRLLADDQVDHATRELHIHQPKVKRAKIIPIETAMLRLLRQLRRPGTTYLLAGPDGQPLSIERINTVWAATRRRAKLRAIRFNDLRHTFATRALEAGGTVPEVGEMLGHKAPKYAMTWRYVHAMAEGKRATIRSMLGLKRGHRKRARSR